MACCFTDCPGIHCVYLTQGGVVHEGRGAVPHISHLGCWSSEETVSCRQGGRLTCLQCTQVKCSVLAVCWSLIVILQSLVFIEWQTHRQKHSFSDYTDKTTRYTNRGQEVDIPPLEGCRFKGYYISINPSTPAGGYHWYIPVVPCWMLMRCT